MQLVKDKMKEVENTICEKFSFLSKQTHTQIHLRGGERGREKKKEIIWLFTHQISHAKDAD